MAKKKTSKKLEVKKGLLLQAIEEIQEKPSSERSPLEHAVLARLKSSGLLKQITS